MELLNKMYIQLSKIFGYCCHIMAIIGARGIGKTYAVKKKVIKDFICANKKFVWLRDTEVSCAEVASNNGDKFFTDVKHEFDLLEGTIKKDLIYINGKHAGYLMPISTYYNYKGTAYTDIENIVFDEFIPESSQFRVQRRTEQFINTLETICRNRTNVRVFLLANALDLSNDLLQLLDVKIKNFGFYVNRKKNTVLWYCPNSAEYDDARSKSIVGNLIKNTAYSDNILGNKFSDTDLYYTKMPSKCILGYILCTSEHALRLYFSGGKIYACNDFNSSSYTNRRFVSNIMLCDDTHRLIDKTLLIKLKKEYATANILFDNAFTKNTFLEFVNAV